MHPSSLITFTSEQVPTSDPHINPHGTRAPSTKYGSLANYSHAEWLHCLETASDFIFKFLRLPAAAPEPALQGVWLCSAACPARPRWQRHHPGGERPTEPPSLRPKLVSIIWVTQTLQIQAFKTTLSSNKTSQRHSCILRCSAILWFYTSLVLKCSEVTHLRSVNDSCYTS